MNKYIPHDKLNKINKVFINECFNNLKEHNPKLLDKTIHITDDRFVPMTTFRNDDKLNKFNIKFPPVYNINREMYRKYKHAEYNYCKCSNDVILSCKQKEIILHLFTPFYISNADFLTLGIIIIKNKLI